MVSLIIPARNEELVAWTVENARRAPGCEIEVILIDDASDWPGVVWPPSGCRRLINPKPLGNGPSRDRGIREASHDTVVLLDAHMTLPDGWAVEAHQRLSQDPTVLACTICEGIPHPDAASDPRVPSLYFGASLEREQVTSSKHYRIWQGVWMRDDAHREAVLAGQSRTVPCLMGGAYVFSRSHYLDALAAPWRYLRGWGSSEPTISIVQRRLGYHCEVWPMRFGHLFRAQAPYRVPEARVLANQLLCAMLAGWGWEQAMQQWGARHPSVLAAKQLLAQPVTVAGQAEPGLSPERWVETVLPRFVRPLAEVGSVSESV